MNNHKRQELMKQMQLACHDIGVEEFTSMVAEVYRRASEDTEDFEDKSISERYSIYAQYMETLNEPEDDLEETDNSTNPL